MAFIAVFTSCGWVLFGAAEGTDVMLRLRLPVEGTVLIGFKVEGDVII